MDALTDAIGVGTWTFPWAVGTVTEYRPPRPMDPVGLVRAARRLGAGVVQFLDNLPLHELDGDGLEGLRRTAAAERIQLEIGTRGVNPEHLRRYLTIAEMLGARLVRSMPGWPGENRPLTEVEQDLREILPAFAEAGVTLALENYETYPTHDLASLVKRIDEPHLGICLDLTNSFGAMENAAEILDALAPYTVNLHVKDFVVRRMPYLMGFAFEGRPIGQGKLPLEKIFAALAGQGRKPNVIIELWTPFQGELQPTLALEESWAEQSVQFLRGLPFFAAP